MGDLDEVSKLLGRLEGSAERTEKNIGRIFARLDALPCREHAARIDAAFVEMGRRKGDAPPPKAKPSLLTPTWAKTLATAGAAALAGLLTWIATLFKGDAAP